MSPNPTFDRRQLLRNGGLALSLGALIAACGDDRSGSDAPGRLGVADEAPELPDGEVNDAVLLRTAQSIEYSLIALYSGLDAAGALSGDLADAAAKLVDEHTRHAGELDALIGQAGGEPFTCENKFFMDRVVNPVLDAVGGSDDPGRDGLSTTQAFESMVAATYQAFVGMLEDPELRSEAMRIGTEENRHAAAVALMANPDNLYSPVLVGEPLVYDSLGFPIPYAIPATFGQVGSIELVIGDVDEEGSRYEISLQTPAENTFVYDSMSC